MQGQGEGTNKKPGSISENPQTFVKVASFLWSLTFIQEETLTPHMHWTWCLMRPGDQECQREWGISRMWPFPLSLGHDTFWGGNLGSERFFSTPNHITQSQSMVKGY